MEVRPVRPEEHDEAGRVTREAYEEFATSSDHDWTEYLVRVADVDTRTKHARVLVAEDEGRILGTVTLELDEHIPGGHLRDPLAPDEAHVRMLGVDPGARRRGVGRALMEACAYHAREAGKQRLTLHTMPEQHAAQSLYESLGFRRGPDVVWAEDHHRVLAYELGL